MNAQPLGRAAPSGPPAVAPGTTAPHEPGMVRYAFLDGVRALAALYVVAHHVWLEIWPIGVARPQGMVGVLTGWLAYGHFAVSIFIVVSGFSLMLPVVRHGWRLRDGGWDFLRRRAWRILPPYYAALAFAVVLITLLIGRKTGTHWDISVPIETRGLIACLLLLQDVMSISNINHVFWSIAIEWRIYFTFPLLVLGWRRLGPLRTIAVALVVTGGLIVILDRLGEQLMNPQFLVLFVFGMCGAAVATGREPLYAWLRVRVPWAAVAVAGFLVLIAVCWRMNRPFYLPYLTRQVPIDLFLGLIAVSALIAAARPGSRNLLRGVLGWRPLAFVGLFSYSIYLIHAPLIQVVWQYAVHPLGFGPVRTFLVTFALSIPVVLVVSYLFHRVFERPFMSRAKRRPAPAAAEAAPVVPEAAI